MDKAEEYFWDNLPKHNLTPQNTIDREKVNFDDIIKLMDEYAQQVSRERAEEAFKAGRNDNLPRKVDFDEWRQHYRSGMWSEKMPT